MRGTTGLWAAAIAAFALAATLAGGCVQSGDGSGQAHQGSEAGGVFPATVTDDASRSVTIATRPARIVSLAPANTEILYALGRLDDVVGVTTYDDYPAAVQDIEKMGDFIDPNMEAVTAAQPDLVLVTGGVQADVLSKLEGTGAKVLVIDPQDLDGVYRAIKTVAKATGDVEQGDQVVAEMQRDLIEVRDKIGDEPPVSCFIEVGWDPLFTAGPGTLIDDLMTQAGGRNVVTQPGYVSYSVEQLVKDQPAVYMGTHSSIGDGASLPARPGYSQLECVKKGDVVKLDDNLVSRPGPRVVEGVTEMARVLHPDAFE